MPLVGCASERGNGGGLLDGNAWVVGAFFWYRRAGVVGWAGQIDYSVDGLIDG
ncbi:hypothetical protein BKA80DRAFT_274356 [Phyllosticta citrichinensis]